MKISSRQRTIMIACGALVVCMLLYPPFQIMGRGMGYGWIFSPPHSMATINSSQLVVQWIAVGIIGAIAITLASDSSLSAKKNNGARTIFLRASIPLFRFVRAIFLIIGGWQFIGVAMSLIAIANLGGDPSADLGGSMAIVVLKFMVALLCFGICALLRWAIHRSYFSLYGSTHPALLRWWNL